MKTFLFIDRVGPCRKQNAFRLAWAARKHRFPDGPRRRGKGECPNPYLHRALGIDAEDHQGLGDPLAVAILVVRMKSQAPMTSGN